MIPFDAKIVEVGAYDGENTTLHGWNGLYMTKKIVIWGYPPDTLDKEQMNRYLTSIS